MTRVLAFLVCAVRDLMLLTLLIGVRFYQLWISPWLPKSCRYEPTCSEYARQCLHRYGPLRGSWRALRRIARCHPWSDGGWDPP